MYQTVNLVTSKLQYLLSLLQVYFGQQDKHLFGPHIESLTNRQLNAFLHSDSTPNF